MRIKAVKLFFKIPVEFNALYKAVNLICSVPHTTTEETMIESTSVAAIMPQSSVVSRSRKIVAKHKDLLDSFQPIYYFSRAFGLMPFSIERSSDGYISGPRVNKIDIAWLVAAILIYSLATVVTFKYVRFDLEPSTQCLNMLVILNNLHTTLGLIFCGSIIGLDLYNRFHSVDLFRRFAIFDKEVSLNAWMLSVLYIISFSSI